MLFTTRLCVWGFAQLGQALVNIPEGFTLHDGIARVYKSRAEMIHSGKHLDWATCEALAFASLCKEGNRYVVARSLLPAPAPCSLVPAPAASACQRNDPACV